MSIAPPPRSRWHSKSTIAYLGHGLVATGGMLSIVLDAVKHGAANSGIIFGAWSASHVAINAAHNAATAATERAQANSPEWPETQAQVQARVASIQPVGGAVTPAASVTPTAPTPPQGIHVDLTDIH